MISLVSFYVSGKWFARFLELMIRFIVLPQAESNIYSQWISCKMMTKADTICTENFLIFFLWIVTNYRWYYLEKKCKRKEIFLHCSRRWKNSRIVYFHGWRIKKYIFVAPLFHKIRVSYLPWKSVLIVFHTGKSYE